MAKLRNIETINKIIHGESRWQTRKTIGFSDVESTEARNRTRAIGETWVEKVGDKEIWWTQKDGYRTKSNVSPEVSETLYKLREELRSFPNCPKEECTCKAPKPIDLKFKNKTGMCEECTISYETSLKIKGGFKEYAMQKMKNNALAFFNDADKEVEAIKRSFSDVSYVNEDGSVDKWIVDNKDLIVTKIETDYAKFKEDVIKSFEEDSSVTE